ncbi:MAG: DinB family protein, partial [Melioribacteraceae bacterium]|nr:DinB family protein [Melioribacteraceae bacterium]
YQLLDHLARAQRDFLGFISDPKHQSPEWPKGLWTDKETASGNDWKELSEEFFAGLDEMESLIKNKGVDIFAPIPHAPQYTIYREALMLASHNSYHLGQLMLMKKALSEK